VPSFLSSRLIGSQKFMTDKSHQCVIVGIAGASASGKSLIASTLYRELRDQVGDEHIGVIPEDSYYKDQSHLPMEERLKTNYDHPLAFDNDLLIEHLHQLLAYKPVEKPVYDYTLHTRSEEIIPVEPKDVIILEGDLGAGKTTFTKGLAKGLGVKRVVNSPTFNIIKEYKGRLPLYHMDVYRLAESEEDLGFDEYFYGEGITVVEWAHLIEAYLPNEKLQISLFHAGDDTRKIVLEPVGDRYIRLCEELLQDESTSN